jgi:hypothetical protein
MTIKRIQVKETERYYGNFEGSLESIIYSLQADLDAGWEGLESDYEYDYGNAVYYLYKHREENDKEYKKRMKLLETEKQQKEKAKAIKLEKLKKELSSLSKEEKEQLGLIGDNK